jgi:hypothetical protein
MESTNDHVLRAIRWIIPDPWFTTYRTHPHLVSHQCALLALRVLNGCSSLGRMRGRFRSVVCAKTSSNPGDCTNILVTYSFDSRPTASTA